MRILIHRLGSLGDTVLALPCFRLVREAYPDASITVLTNAPVSGKAAPLESILASTGLIDAAIPYPLGLRDPKQIMELRARLRAEKFDLLVSLAASRGLVASIRDMLFFKSCAIPRIVGIPLAHRDLVCVRRPDGAWFESEAERLLRRVRSIGHADLHDRRWIDLGLREEEKAEAARLLARARIDGKFLAVSLGTKTPLNHWGQANWAQLLAQLSGAYPELGLVLLGSADEFDPSQALLTGWKGPSANLCGAASSRVSAALLERATLYAGHDSGPMHLAAAAGTRCVTIYSARCPPGQWFPVGSGHTNLYPHAFYDPAKIEDLAYQQKALASITVAEVFSAIESGLGRGLFD